MYTYIRKAYEVGNNGNKNNVPDDNYNYLF